MYDVLHRFLLVCVILCSGLLVSRPTGDSPTHDEWSHLIRGVAFWNASDTRLSYAHPPLANALTAWRVADDAPPIDESLPAWRDLQDPGELAYQTLQDDYATWRDLLVRARKAMSILFVLGLAYVAAWTRRTHGNVTALATTAFIGFNPTVLAQAQYVTTDLPVAFAAFAVVAQTPAYLRSRSPVAWLHLAVPLALALCLKHSAVLLVPFVCGVIALAASIGPRCKLARFAAPIPKALRVAFVDVLLIGAFCTLAIDLVYRFDQVGLTLSEVLATPEPQYWVSEPYEGRLLERMSPLRVLPGWLPIPLPYTYVFGLTAVRAQSIMGFPSAVFMGEPTPMGHPGYFPTLLFFKTPIPILLLLGVGIVLLLRGRRLPTLSTRLFAVSLVGFMLVLVNARLNMGIRHALFAELVLALLAGGAFGRLWRATSTLRLRLALLLLPVACLVTAVRENPSYLGWFSPLVGRERGLQISPVGDDWGQDRERLATWLEQRPERLVFLDTQTPIRTLEIEHLRIRHVPLPCRVPSIPGALVVIHRTTLATADDRCLAWRDRARLEAIVSHHIMGFRLELAPGG